LVEDMFPDSLDLRWSLLVPPGRAS
jgi:hypothetical protein